MVQLDGLKGLSLRYALPLLMLWGFLGFLAVFPFFFPWWRRTRWSLGIGSTLVILTLFVFLKNARLPGLPHSSPELGLTAITWATAVLAVFWIRRGGRTCTIAGAIAVVLVAQACSGWSRPAL